MPRSSTRGTTVDLPPQRDLLDVLEGLVASRTRVQLIGAAAVGKTTVLSLLEAELRERDFSVVRVRGVHGLRRHPLAALMLATSGAFDPSHLRNRGRMPATVSGVATVLRSILGPGPSAVLVDDADELDATTAGVVDSVCRERWTPVVLTRTPTSPDEIDVATEQLAADATSLTIRPLDLEQSGRLLRQWLDAPVDPSTISRIHTLSGGVVGLLLAIAADAVREGRLRSRRGVWTADADVWSPALSAHAVRHIGRLPEDERRALELISLASPCPLATATSLASRGALSSLASRGLLRAVAARGEQYTAVHPPLLAENFRRTAGSLRARLLLTPPLGDESAPAAASALVGEDPDDSGSLHQLMRDRADAERRAARERWVREPRPETAVSYLSAIESETDAEALAWDVLARTPPTGDPLDRVALQIAGARWSAMTTTDSAAASDLELPDAESSAGALAIADAARAMIDATFRTVPRAIAPAAPSGHLPARARAAVTDAEVFALVCRARFDEAVAAFDSSQRDAETRGLVSDTSRALYGVALLGQGRAEDAAAWLDARLRSARDALDADATRVHALARMFTYLVDGELHLARRCAESVREVGEPSRVLRGQRLAFLNMSGVLAARQGDPELAQLNADLLAELQGPDGPLPTQSPAWLDAQLAASAGDSSTAATMLWDAAESLWDRDARFSAALGMLVAAETSLDERLLAEASDRIRPLGSPFLDAQLAYVSAAAERSASSLIEAVPALIETGRRSLALEALRVAVALLRAEGDVARADACRAQIGEIARSFGSRVPDTVRYNAARHSLSDREIEVARLAAQGLPNSEIADRLGVSVRTVESHIYRCLRKLGLGGRHELRDYLSAEAPLG